jgi:ribonuclease BN (tRNA processing enzyme)
VQHVVRSHTSFRDVGRIAQEAGVKKLVLSHFVPGDATVDREAVTAEIRKSFQGELVFGEDLMVLTPATLQGSRRLPRTSRHALAPAPGVEL